MCVSESLRQRPSANVQIDDRFRQSRVLDSDVRKIIDHTRMRRQQTVHRTKGVSNLQTLKVKDWRAT